MLVRDILKSKGTEVYSVQPNRTVYEAIAKMDELDIGALLVMRDKKLKGMISERDYRSKVILKGRRSKNTNVSEIMSANVYTVNRRESVKNCMAIMTDKKIRHLPVMDGNKVEGVISIGDLVKNIISRQKGEISSLRNYIQGEGAYPG